MKCKSLLPPGNSEHPTTQICRQRERWLPQLGVWEGWCPAQQPSSSVTCRFSTRTPSWVLHSALQGWTFRSSSAQWSPTLTKWSQTAAECWMRPRSCPCPAWPPSSTPRGSDQLLTNLVWQNTLSLRSPKPASPWLFPRYWKLWKHSRRRPSGWNISAWLFLQK